MIYGDADFPVLLKSVIVDGARHSLYHETVEHAEAMAVHVNGDKPVYLLERSRPREDEEVKLYRIQNYEPTTKAGSDKSLDILSKMFNPTIYSIRWKEGTENEQTKDLQEYTLDYFPDYNSLMTFNKDVLLKRMIADPNGVAVVKPMRSPENDATKVDPVVKIYGSASVYYYDIDHFLFFISKTERALDEFNNRKKTDVYTFEYYDSNFHRIFESYYNSDTKEIVIDEISTYNHGFGEIPAWKLRGKSRSKDNGEIMFESFFSSALPHWNLAIIHESDLLGAYINHLHPQKYELASECAYQFPWEGNSYPCRGGMIKYPVMHGEVEKWNTMACPTCQGSGLTTVKSPYGAYQFTKEKLDEAGTGGLLPVGYVNIPVEATKMLSERTDEMVRKGMWAINMDVEDKVGENQSGVAKVIDRSAQHDFLYTIASVMFDIHVNNEYYFINKYRNGVSATAARTDDDQNLPQVNKPVTFNIATVAELVNNFSVAKQSGLDRNFLRTKQIEILSRDMTTNPDMKKYLVMLINLDPLYGFTQEEISLEVNAGVTRKVDWAIHNNLKTFVDRAIMQNSNFVELDKLAKMAILESYANELIASQKPQVDSTIFDPAAVN